MATDSISQDRRKRALEALERRFAVAKTELLQQQKKSKNRPNEEDRKENNNANSSSVSSSARLADASVTPSLTSSSKKGNNFFSSHASSQDMEDNGLTYLQLSQPVHENPLTSNVEFQGKKGSTVDKVLHELLQHGDSAQKYMQGSRSMKIDNWILLDNYVQGRGKYTASHIRALQTHSKRSKKHMSMKQHKKCGTFDLPHEFHKFDVFKPMHEMWKGYMMQLIKNTGINQLAHCLLSADLHGAIILVAECKIMSFTGVSGIMVRETAQTFGIITEDDKFRVVPKTFSVFMFQVDCWRITLHGDKFTSRNLGL